MSNQIFSNGNTKVNTYEFTFPTIRKIRQEGFFEKNVNVQTFYVVSNCSKYTISYFVFHFMLVCFFSFYK